MLATEFSTAGDIICGHDLRSEFVDCLLCAHDVIMQTMTSSNHKNLRALAFALLLLLITGQVGREAIAQTSQQVLARSGHLNDFAGIVDKVTKQRLETILANVLERSGIEFDIAVVESTGNQDIFAFSRDLARDWRTASRTTLKKSLLLVLSVNEKVMFTQFSRSVQGDLPEGVLGEMGQQMRENVSAGRFTEALVLGINYFIDRVSKNLGFSTDNLDQASQTAAASEPAPTDHPAPTETPSEEAGGANETRNVKYETKPLSDSASASVKSKTRPKRAAKPQEEVSEKLNSSKEDEDEAEEVELTLTLPLDERIVRLQEFLESKPSSKARPRAIELLVSAHATLGDQKLRDGNSSAGVEHMMSAINLAPSDISDKFYLTVVNQIPMNLYLRNERTEAIKAAQRIEGKFGSIPQRLLALAGFYLGIEQGDEAVRLARQVLEVAPDMAEGHHALAAGLHLLLRLDEAAAEYKRALELDPASKGTRRSLADVSRGLGKTEEALALYREHLAVEPEDKHARAGLVLSLLELGRTEEANKELEAALESDPKNLALLTGAAYWFVAHGNGDRGLELASKAVELEPRYTWAQIALARSLIATKRLAAAERTLRFARQYGKFPTLDYELANVLAGSGLYDEAVETLVQSFTIVDGKIETKLAGHIAASDSDFVSLLAPERRASIFQYAGADQPENAGVIKKLLVFASATTKNSEDAKLDEATALAAGKEFAAGDDEMSTYRRLYVANRLLRNHIALEEVYNLAQGAKAGVETAVNTPQATVAAQAEEFREIRARAIAAGGTPDIADAPKSVLSNIVQGRIEDLSGWSLFNQNQWAPAVEHLRLAVKILPEGTPSWRGALWHLGAALEQTGENEEALSYYIKSYNNGEPEAFRRSVIEQLYVKINGSLDGFEKRLATAEIAKVSAASSTSPEAATKESIPEAPTATRPSLANETEVVSSTSEAPTKKEEAAPSPAGAPDAPGQSGTAEPTTVTVTDPSIAPAPDAKPSESQPPEPPPNPSPGASEVPTPVPTASGEESTPTKSETAPPTGEPATGESATVPSPTNASDAPIAAESPTGDKFSTPKMRDGSMNSVEIAGRVKDSSGYGISNAVVVLISQLGNVIATTTDAQGKYSFVVAISRRSYRIIPSKDGYNFDPFDKILPNMRESQKSVDFLASPRPAN